MIIMAKRRDAYGSDGSAYGGDDDAYGGAVRGDTLTEVSLAIAVISFVIMGVAATMLSTLATSQKNLEQTMAQAEIDMQATALRFIHNAYASQSGFPTEYQQYKDVWDKIKGLAVGAGDIPSLNTVESCYDFYDEAATATKSLYNHASFVINTHKLYPVGATGALATDMEGVRKQKVSNKVVIATNSPHPETGVASKTTFRPAALVPRVIYGAGNVGDAGMSIMEGTSDTEAELVLAEGVWVTAVKGGSVAGASQPQYYDFYIRTCWDSSTAHTTATMGTIIRLHNPDAF